MLPIPGPSFSQNDMAAFHETLSTGRSSPLKRLGGFPMMTFHWPSVTCIVAIRKGLVILTLMERLIIVAPDFIGRAAHHERARP